MITVAVDAMGGDNAPSEIVKGAVNALNARQDVKVALVGLPEVINRELAEYTYDKGRLDVVPASEVIATEEPPVNAIRSKKDSSVVVALNLVKKKQADAFVSCGSTGAVLVGGQRCV